MADERIDLNPAYDGDAKPSDYTARAERGRGPLVQGLKRLRRINGMKASIEAQRKALLRELVPMMDRPLTMLDPDSGKPILATAVQAVSLNVSVPELRSALIEYGMDEDEVETIVADVLKPPEVDTSEDGLFVQACSTGPGGEPPRIPAEVAAKVIKEKPSNAYILFPKMQKQASKRSE